MSQRQCQHCHRCDPVLDAMCLLRFEMVKFAQIPCLDELIASILLELHDIRKSPRTVFEPL